ncbi:hypothetical protein MHLP_03715 [Candidatus Mycoplasma haematolamae str. Purdue]|uniref:Metallothionein n=1 Tax=Mycoplasma haematolamae (strain Purdue) TaxID=1212765 RepID=I7BKB4_MYCHA|nr:hypothetical protein [Candidatus Mycoplasma haematolamae]AFO52323.1 hypothetical protein MHLP_03715 [Candidatus Mycoplasma haematolamae str. Purdue]
MGATGYGGYEGLNALGVFKTSQDHNQCPEDCECTEPCEQECQCDPPAQCCTKGGKKCCCCKGKDKPCCCTCPKQ